MLLFCLILSACATAPKQAQIISSDKNSRIAYLATHQHWAFNGRFAYSQLGEGGSAKAQWQQNKSATDLTLSSALNIGTLRLIVRENTAQLIGSNGSRRVDTPDALMQAMLKTPVPFSTLVSGLRADWVGHSKASIIWRDGLPYQVDIDGWRWQYQEWTSEPAVLPRKIELSQGNTRLRVVIDQWLEVADD